MLEYAEGLPEPLAISVHTTCATDGPVAPDNLSSQERAKFGSQHHDFLPTISILQHIILFGGPELSLRSQQTRNPVGVMGLVMYKSSQLSWTQLPNEPHRAQKSMSPL